MNEAEIYLLANDLSLYNNLQSLSLLEPVTEIMQNFIEGEKESYEIGIGKLQGENDNLMIMIHELELRVDYQEKLVNKQNELIQEVERLKIKKT